MKNIWTIAKREFNMYFVSPVAYAVAFAFLIVLGLIFYGNFTQAVVGAGFGGGGSPDYVGWVLSPFTTLMLFLSPAVTMRLMAEEQRTGTLELLLTAPVREWELVTGKWLAAFGFMAVIVFLTGIYGLILNNYTTPGLDRGAILVAYVGLLFMIAAMLAVGVFASTLFSNQIATFFAAMAFLLALWLVSLPFRNDTGTLATVFNYLDFSGHFYNNFYNGSVDLADVVYFSSLTALFLFLATRVVESRRWR
jgi:ABC-2 type transport system permease protein